MHAKFPEAATQLFSEYIYIYLETWFGKVSKPLIFTKNIDINIFSEY